MATPSMIQIGVRPDVSGFIAVWTISCASVHSRSCSGMRDVAVHDDRHPLGEHALDLERAARLVVDGDARHATTALATPLPSSCLTSRRRSPR